MKKPRKKVPYKKPSKRNLMVDVQTDAARRAKVLAAEKQAIASLRAAVGNPTNSKGKPVAGHVVATIAANHLIAVPGKSAADDFRHCAHKFLGYLHYGRAYLISVSSLWLTFISQLETADANFAAEVAREYEPAFRWYLAGYHKVGLQSLLANYFRLVVVAHPIAEPPTTGMEIFRGYLRAISRRHQFLSPARPSPNAACKNHQHACVAKAL